jgi:hypothetical protein
MKKRFIGLTFFLISILAFCQKTNPELTKYVDFLEKQNVSAKDYVLGLFKKYDIVILCERNHNEATQYELITDIAKDKYFKKKVGNICMEIGVSNLEPEINKFLTTDNLSTKEIIDKSTFFQRNVPFYALWEANSYQKFLISIYNLNNNSKYKILLHPSDIDFKWSEIKDGNDYKNYLVTKKNIIKRDSILASHMINYYEAINKKHKKTLIIINYRHAFKENMPYSKGIQDNAANYIFKKYGNRVANVMINSINNSTNELLQNGNWDASFYISKLNNIGFNFENSPFGNDNFDYWNFKNNFNYKDVFTGFVFYKPIEEHKAVSNIPNFITDDFQKEFFRRWEITGTLFPNFKKIDLTNTELVKKIIEDFNTVKETKYYKVEKLLEQRNKVLNNQEISNFKPQISN